MASSNVIVKLTPDEYRLLRSLVQYDLAHPLLAGNSTSLMRDLYHAVWNAEQSWSEGIAEIIGRE